VILYPDIYRCPTHNIDLTMLVREQLVEDDGAPGAYGWRDRRASRSPSGARKFTVIVSCPGMDSLHPLTCRGTVTP
jgi:hypothetical protein